MSQFQPPLGPHPAYTDPNAYQHPEPLWTPSQPLYEHPPQIPRSAQEMPPSGHLPGPFLRTNKAGRWAVFASIIALIIVIVFIYWWANQGTSSNTSHNAGMTEQQYKDSTTTITVADLDKDGNTVSGTDVHFTATILSFVKDSNGNTAGANVSDPGSYSGIIQVLFPAGTDITQLNTQDTIEVWGTDEGTFTGTNAFGVTVHEVAVSALYLDDQTTGYTTG
ncbi:MAG: hypothetical protein ACRDIV_14720 [Ktedonobacteraceae bacterium]